MPKKNTFPVGARVLVDGRYTAIVREAFPEGSTSALFPHYRLDFPGGERNVKIAAGRVDIVRVN